MTDGDEPAAPTRAGGGLANPLKADLPLRVRLPRLGLVRAATPRRQLPPPTSSSRTPPAEQAPWTWRWIRSRQPQGRRLPRRRQSPCPGRLDLSAAIASSCRGRRADRIGAPDARHRHPADSVLAARHAPGPRSVNGSTAACAGRACGNTRGKPALASRYRYPDVPPGGIVNATLARPGAAVQRHADEAGHELRRRDHEPQAGRQGRATHRRGRRREPPYRLPGAADQSQSVSGPVRQRSARGRRDPAARRHATTSSSTAPTAAGAGAFHVQVLGQRLAAAVDQARHAPGASRSPAPHRDGRCGLRDRRHDDRRRARRASNDGSSPSSRARTTSCNADHSARPTDPGKHRLRIQVSDYQESRNMENVAPILPSTRVLTTTIVVK